MFFGEARLRRGGGSLVLLFGLTQLTQRIVPVGLEAVGHQSVVGIDRQIASPRRFGPMTGPLDVAGAQRVGFAGAGFKFCLDAEGDVESDRSDAVEQELADGRIDGGTGHGVTRCRAGLDGLSHAAVVGNLDTAPLVIADGHAPPAASTHRQPLEQRRPFTRRATATFTSVRGGVGSQSHLVEFELFPGDVAGVGIEDQRGPVLTRHLLGGDLAVDALATTQSPIGERTRIARIVKRPQHPPVSQWHPGQFALVHSRAHPRRE